MKAIAVALGLVSSAQAVLVPGPWSNIKDTPEDRAQALLANMTVDEKMGMLHGPLTGQNNGCLSSPLCAYVGNIAPVERLGIPPINMEDGPQGFRVDAYPKTTTAWPSGLTMAATWDVDAVNEWGSGMGKEFYAKGANVQLGPGLCVARVPRNGRNFEYLSGEDPYLGYYLGKAAVEGIQSEKVVANAKHWVLNNQETNRMGVSEEADERTRFEIYYPPFAGAVEAGVGSVMCSYNQVNGMWSCENPVTLAELKNATGFQGYVMSDWGATHSTSLPDGLDVEMPAGDYMNPTAVQAGLDDGSISSDALDDAVYRILWSMFSVGVMDEPLSAWDWSKISANVTTQASLDSARSLSAKATVLLKNEKQVLPLPTASSKTFAVIGFGSDNAVVHGGGSGSVVPSYIVKPVDGVRAAAGASATVTFDDGSDIDAAAAKAAEADYAIVFVATLSGEGSDRVSLSLDDGCTDHLSHQCAGNPSNQNALVEAIAAANAKTIVVASIPGAVLMPWSTSANITSIVTNFLGGQQTGNAIADVLFGAVNPSAKLPITLPNKENEHGFSTEQWPGAPDPADPAYAVYSEELLVGYRDYEARNIQFTTGFPFGHGLSYTTFEYAGLVVSPTEAGPVVAFDLMNSGAVAGAEIVQLYLGFPKDAGEPPKQLKGFQKVVLEAGAVSLVSLQLSDRDFSVWDPVAHAWAKVEGDFELFLGSSSRDVRLKGVIKV